MRPRVTDGGGEGTRATTDEGAERGIREVAVNEGVCTRKSEHDITKDACGRAGQAGQEGVPRGETATSEVVEDTEAEITDTDNGEAKYLSERVDRAERGTRRTMYPRKGRATSTGMIGDEFRCRTVPNPGCSRGKISVGGEHAVRYPTNSREEQGSGRRPRAENGGSQGEVCEDRIWRIGSM